MPAPLHSFRRQPRSMHAQRGPLSRSSCSLRPPLHDLFLNATCRAEPRTLRIIARSPSWLCRRIGEAMATHIIINDNLCCSCWQSRQVTTGDGANLLIRLDIFTGLVRDGKADAGPNMPPTEHQGSLCTASGCCRSVFAFRDTLLPGGALLYEVGGKQALGFPLASRCAQMLPCEQAGLRGSSSPH